MSKKRRRILLLTSLILVLSIFLNLSFGVAELTPVILKYVRLPRTLACIFAGAGLAVSGSVIQNVLSNKLASPGIIGVNAGAGFAVTVCCASGVLSGWAIAGSAFTGAVLAVLLVVGVAQKMNASRTTVILGGVAINSFLNAGSEAIITLFPDVGAVSGDFRVGGFASVTTARLIPAIVLISIGLMIVFSLANELDVMCLGEETAQGLGLPVKMTRTILLVTAALLAGASVSFAGLLGFVGLIVPHIVRKLVGSESHHVLPMCAIGGASIVALCDFVSRMIFQPYEIPVGIIMSFIGGPFFVFLLLKNKGGHRRD